MLSAWRVLAYLRPSCLLATLKKVVQSWRDVAAKDNCRGLQWTEDKNNQWWSKKECLWSRWFNKETCLDKCPWWNICSSLTPLLFKLCSPLQASIFLWTPSCHEQKAVSVQHSFSSNWLWEMIAEKLDLRTTLISSAVHKTRPMWENKEASRQGPVLFRLKGIARRLRGHLCLPWP